MTPKILPVIPLRDIVVFPGVTMPLFVGRARTLRALAAAQDTRTVFAVAQRDGKGDNPAPSDLYEVGTIVAVIEQTVHAADTRRVIVAGGRRARVRHYVEADAFLQTEVELLDNPPSDAAALTEGLKALAKAFERALGVEHAATNVARMQAVLELPGLSDADRLQKLGIALA